MNRTVKPFSAGYYILNADTLTHTGDRVITPQDFFGELLRYVDHPLLRIGEAHYWPMPENSVPGNTIAVPEDIGDTDGNPVLMAKNDTTARLVKTGEKELPA